MPIFENVKAITLPVADPGASNTLPQYGAVTFTATGVNEPAAVSDDIIGVALESVTKAEFDSGKVVVPVAPLRPGAIIPMVASKDIAVGDDVTFVITTGRATDAAAVGTQLRIGKALTAAGAAGDIFSVLVMPADHG